MFGSICGLAICYLLTTPEDKSQREETAAQMTPVKLPQLCREGTLSSQAAFLLSHPSIMNWNLGSVEQCARLEWDQFSSQGFSIRDQNRQQHKGGKKAKNEIHMYVAILKLKSL